MEPTFEQVLKNYIDKFLGIISAMCREGFEYDREFSHTYKSGFSMFGVADRLYYKGKYQEEYMEWMIRDQLVNESLNFLFKKYGYDIRWRLRNECLTTGGFTNAENEAKFPVEFFVVIDGKYIAFRYTPFEADYSISLNLPSDMQLMYHQTGMESISQWISIDWECRTKEELVEKKNQKKIKDHDSFQRYISVVELFEMYFSLDEYNVFIKEISGAIEKANKIIGFQTISRLVPSNMSVFKDDVAKDLLETKFEDLEYLIVDEEGNTVENGQGQKVVEARIGKNFIEESRYLALIGDTKFAKSFVTSEYLYKIFKEGLSLDYTAVVAGYIKAIEQLCEAYLNDIILKDSTHKLYVLARRLEDSEYKMLRSSGEIKKVKRLKYVLVKPENEGYYMKHPTLGQMRNMFDANRTFLFEHGIDDSLDIIMNCWKNFIDFDRNGFFHKDNIDDFEVVERIRNNTRLLIFWLIGSISPKIENDNLLKVLGIYDTSFDKVFKKIAYRRQYRYRIEGENGTFMAIRIPKKTQYLFDGNGHIIDGELEFIAVDEYPINFPEYYEYISTINEDCIICYTKDNLPKSMILVNYDGSEEIII